MELRQLRYFAEVAALENFSKAASSLRIAQPAISRQVQKLEDELGVELFSRVGRGMVLTKAGSLLAQHAAFVLRSVDRARDAVIAEATVPKGRVVLGAPPSVGHLLFGRVVAAYRSRHPGVTLAIVEATSHNVVEWVRNGTVDIAVASKPRGALAAPATELSYVRLASEGVHLFARKSDRRLPRGVIDLANLPDVPMVLQSGENIARQLIEAEARKRGVAIKLAAEVESLPVMKELVDRGLGFGVVPRSGLSDDFKRFRSAEIRGVMLVRWLVRRTDRPPSPAVSELARITTEVMSELVAADHFGKGPLGQRADH
jgi:LysR family nitrogen assimilation transcriptional regulator